jgi:hypothetical protein
VQVTFAGGALRDIFGTSRPESARLRFGSDLVYLKVNFVCAPRKSMQPCDRSKTQWGSGAVNN